MVKDPLSTLVNYSICLLFLKTLIPENKHVSCQHLATGFSYILRPELSVIILSSLGWDLVNK